MSQSGKTAEYTLNTSWSFKNQQARAEGAHARSLDLFAAVISHML